jgi:hypothetical protein
MKWISKKRTFFSAVVLTTASYLNAYDRRRLASLLAASALIACNAQAADTYQSGHITRVSYATTRVLIMLDTGYRSTYKLLRDTVRLDDDCCTPNPIISFVSGLWFRGDAAVKQLAVYTSGIDGTGYCQINQIDAQTAG